MVILVERMMMVMMLVMQAIFLTNKQLNVPESFRISCLLMTKKERKTTPVSLQNPKHDLDGKIYSEYIDWPNIMILSRCKHIHVRYVLKNKCAYKVCENPKPPIYYFLDAVASLFSITYPWQSVSISF